MIFKVDVTTPIPEVKGATVNVSMETMLDDEYEARQFGVQAAKLTMAFVDGYGSDD